MSTGEQEQSVKRRQACITHIVTVVGQLVLRFWERDRAKYVGRATLRQQAEYS